MIVSTVSGRMRIRLHRLKSYRISSIAKKNIETLSDVIDVRCNPSAGSMVIRFDDQTDVELLENQVDRIIREAQSSAQRGRKATGKKINQAVKIGMISSLAGSLIYAAYGKKKAHINYGKAFLAFASLHMLKHYKTLLR